MKSKFRLILFAVLAFYVLSTNASDNWDDKIAYRLAVASDCTYKVKEGKRSVIDCFKESANKAGSDVLDIFEELSINDVELFEGKGERIDDKLHAAILVKVPEGLILSFRGTQGGRIG